MATQEKNLLLASPPPGAQVFTTGGGGGAQGVKYPPDDVHNILLVKILTLCFRNICFENYKNKKIKNKLGQLYSLHKIKNQAKYYEFQVFYRLVCAHLKVIPFQAPAPFNGSILRLQLFLERRPSIGKDAVSILCNLQTSLMKSPSMHQSYSYRNTFL